MGALLNHITGGHLPHEDSSGSRSFQPMNVNFGLFPPIELPKMPDGKRPKGREKGLARKRAICARALCDLDIWLGRAGLAAAE
jgi:methylenetetrahydrofolate--tRNA-(uracil-5-)-methyltransferase